MSEQPVSDIVSAAFEDKRTSVALPSDSSFYTAHATYRRRGISDLPVEIVLRIFEEAARASEHEAGTMSLVSRLAYCAASPFRFHTMTLNRRKLAYQLCNFLETHPHVSRHLRNIWMRESVPVDHKLLIPCHNLDCIALLPSCLLEFCKFGNQQYSSGLRICKPRQVTLLPGPCHWNDSTLRVPFSLALFENILRLWLTDTSQVETLLYSAKTIRSMVRLTHLVIPPIFHIVSTGHSALFEMFTSLSILVIIIPRNFDLQLLESSRGWNRAELLCRTFTAPKGRTIHYHFLDTDFETEMHSLWKAHCDGREGIWERAESLLREGQSDESFDSDHMVSNIVSSVPLITFDPYYLLYLSYL